MYGRKPATRQVMVYIRFFCQGYDILFYHEAIHIRSQGISWTSHRFWRDSPLLPPLAVSSLDICFFNFRCFSFFEFWIQKMARPTRVVYYCAACFRVGIGIDAGEGGRRWRAMPLRCQGAFGLAVAGRKGGGGRALAFRGGSVATPARRCCRCIGDGKGGRWRLWACRGVFGGAVP